MSEPRVFVAECALCHTKFTDSPAECPACGARGRLRPHSPYRRGLEDLEGGELVCGRVTIERVRCECGVTHALCRRPRSPTGSCR